MMDDGNLKPDGERFLPQFQGIIELEHYHRYFLAATLAKGKDVLDIASGEGFGSEILSRAAKSVVGVDISKDAVDHASKNYVRKNLRFLHGSATAIPVPDKSFDLIVSFETIEHLAEHDEMMVELKRVLRADGYLISSSPNKLVYTDRPNYSNPFHVRELYTSEFIQLSSRYFSNIRHYGQRVTTGSIIASSEATGSFQTFAPGLEASGVPDQMYDIILASDAALPDLGSSLFEQPYGPLQPQKMEAAIKAYAAKDMEVDMLRNELAQLVQEKSAKELAAEELKVELAKAVETRDTIVTGLAAQNQTLSEQFEMYRAAFYTALRDGQKILEDKWWRRTKRLRKLSNSIRKRKGKEPRIWPTNFEPDRYLAVAHNNI